MTSTDHGTDAGAGRRSGGRAGRQALRASHVVEAETYLTRTMKPFEIVSDEGLEIIEHNADTILEEVGVEIRDYPSALQLFADAGAVVDGDARALSARHVPPDRAGHARRASTSSTPATRARNVQIGGDATVFAPNYGSPFVHDLDNGRRYATLADFQNFVKLTYLSPYLHHSGGTVCEPVDIPVSKRHLDMVYAHLRYSDKPFMGSVTAASRAAGLASSWPASRFGGDLADRTVMTSLINASSPLVWDGTMLGAAEVYARNNQATHHHPVHPRRRDGADHVRRRRRADAGRGARRHGVHAAGPPGRAGDLRIVRLVDVDADRRADVRHARAGDRAVHDRRAGPPARRAVPLRRLAVARRSSPTRRPRTRAPRRCSRRCSAASTSCCTPPAGSRAAWRSATRSSSSTTTSSG